MWAPKPLKFFHPCHSSKLSIRSSQSLSKIGAQDSSQHDVYGRRRGFCAFFPTPVFLEILEIVFFSPVHKVGFASFQKILPLAIQDFDAFQ